MKVIKVKSCDGCPFNYDGIDCKANEPTGYLLQITENRDRTDVPEGSRPDWCPLELGPVTVEVERG